MSNDLFGVQNKIVVITGGLGQLGLQFSNALLERGAKVAIFDTQAEDPATVKKQSRLPFQDHLKIYPVDITSRQSIEKGYQSVEALWGVPDALINNAAVDSPPNASWKENGPLEAYPESSWDRVMEVNVKGVFLCSQVIGAQMAKAGRGSIINISSTYGVVSPDQRLYKYRQQKGEVFFKPLAYSASKSAILNITRYLATYWAEQNVRVNTLTPSGIFNHQDSQFLKEFAARVPLGRMANEDEYNGAIIFLISNASSYMTGSNLVIDGGWTAW